MSAWRRHVNEFLPELKAQFAQETQPLTSYTCFFILLVHVRAAHEDLDDDLLARIYGFAQWCHRQGGDLANSADVAFYEHVFDHKQRTQVVTWLAPDVRRDLAPLWRDRLDGPTWKLIEPLLAEGGVRWNGLPGVVI